MVYLKKLVALNGKFIDLHAKRGHHGISCSSHASYPCSAFISSASATPVLDQSYLLQPRLSGPAIVSAQSIAQVFRVGIGGYLSQVGVQIYKNPNTLGNVTLQILPTINGVPTFGPALFSTTIPITNVPTFTFPTLPDPTVPLTIVDVSATHISVVPGTQLAISLSRVSPGIPPWVVWVGFGTPEYTGGSSFSTVGAPAGTWRPGSETGLGSVGFQTFVEPGAVSPPNFSLSPTSLNFGFVRVRTTSTKQTVSLTNTGAPGLTVSGLEILGVNKADFAISDNSCVGMIAQAGCSFNVSFTPSITSLEAAHVTVNSNAATTINNVGLQGTGATSGEVNKSGTGPTPTKQIDVLAKLRESAMPDYPAAPLPFSTDKQALNDVVAQAANAEWQNVAGGDITSDQCYIDTINALHITANRKAFQAGTVKAAEYIFKAASLTGVTGLVATPIGEIILNVAVGTTLSALDGTPLSENTGTTIVDVSAEVAKYALGRVVNQYVATFGGLVIDGVGSYTSNQIKLAFETYEHNFAWGLQGSTCTDKYCGTRADGQQADFKAQMIYDPYSHYITATIVSTCKSPTTGAIQHHKAYFVVQKIAQNPLSTSFFVPVDPMKLLRSVDLP